jgi:hypothetical protein
MAWCRTFYAPAHSVSFNEMWLFKKYQTHIFSRREILKAGSRANVALNPSEMSCHVATLATKVHKSIHHAMHRKEDEDHNENPAQSKGS